MKFLTVVVCHLCCLQPLDLPKHIPFKTVATTALPLAYTTLKPKVQGSNPAHDIFSPHYNVYVLMLERDSAKGKIVCNMSYIACT